MNTPGDTVDGRFELLERLGSGGMGTVWRARDRVLHREVALKAVRHDAAAGEAVRERVLREARALARVSHPNVVMIHHIVDEDPHPWLVMELVSGVSLQERLAEGPLRPAEAARLGRQVLAALRAADAAGVQHRDVKPANILLRPDGSAVLTDFGIAALQGSTALTATGELIGSPEYIAPERIRGNDDDPASDLWSLGLVLYVCVEGVSPLRRATTLATLAAVLDEAVPPPVRSGPLAPVLQTLLVRDPAARPDAARLDAMLAQVEAGAAPDWELLTATAPPPSATAPLPSAPATEPTHVLQAPTAPTAPAGSPAGSGSAGSSTGGRRGRMALVATAVAVALAAAATVLVLTSGDREDGGDEARGGKGADRVASAGPSSPSAKGTPTRSPSSPDPTKETVAQPPDTADSGKGDGEGDGEDGEKARSGWIAQLHSEPVGTGTAARDQRLATLRRSVPEAVYVRSDDYASLRPGFWVFYAPGPFADGRAALAFCEARGRTSSTTCVGRYLSEDADDYGLQCNPPATAPKGTCTRR